MNISPFLYKGIFFLVLLRLWVMPALDRLEKSTIELVSHTETFQKRQADAVSKLDPSAAFIQFKEKVIQEFKKAEFKHTPGEPIHVSLLISHPESFLNTMKPLFQEHAIFPKDIHFLKTKDSPATFKVVMNLESYNERRNHTF